MSENVRRIYAIASGEWRLAWRRAGLRLALVLIALPFIVPIIGTHHIDPQADDGGIGMLTFAAPYVTLLAAFLVVPTYYREQRVGISALMWSRPLDAGTYLTGKFLGSLLITMAMAVEVVGLIAAYQIAGGGSISVILLPGLFLVVLPALVLSTALYLACAALLPHPTVGYVIAILACGLFGFVISQDMLVLWNPWAQGLTYQPVLGFGPDLPLLLTNRLFYAGMTITLVGLAIFLFPRRERRALRSRIPIVAPGLLAVGAITTGYAVPQFHATANAVWVAGPMAVPATVPMTTHHYSLDLLVDPQTGEVHGSARFTVRNEGRTVIAMLPLFLNDGLHIQSATTDGHAAAIRSAPLFGFIQLVPALRPGAQVMVQLTYAGQYKTLRMEYGGAVRFGLTNNLPDVSVPTSPYLTYIRDDLAMLYGVGDWYPVPWTTESLAHDPAPLDWRTLRIHVPANVIALASTPFTQPNGQEHILSWTLHGRLPSAVLAIVPGGYARLSVQGGTIYAPSMDPTALRQQYEPYVAAFHDMLRYMGRSQRRVSVVAVPIAGGLSAGCCNAGGIPVALGDGLIMVPTYGLDRAQPNPADTTVHVSALPASARYRAALEDVAFAWWANEFSSQTIFIPYVSNPYPSLLTAGGIPLATLVTAGYTAAAVAEQRYGTAGYHQEVTWRRATLDFLRQRVAMPKSTMYQQYLTSPLGATALRLGLFGRLVDPDGATALDQLRRRIGPRRLKQILIGMSRTAQMVDSPSAAACALSRATGYPIGAWLNRSNPGFLTPPTATGCS